MASEELEGEVMGYSRSLYIDCTRLASNSAVTRHKSLPNNSQRHRIDFIITMIIAKKSNFLGYFMRWDRASTRREAEPLE
jgi:hypothetical protein